MRSIFFISVILLLSACKGEQKESTMQQDIVAANINEINLSHNFSGSKCEALRLSDIVEDVEYIQLETTDDCLIGKYSTYALDSQNIYILNKNYTKELLLRFDRTNGKYINQIGKVGQGPQEMLSPGFIYAENEHVYVSSNISNKVYIYNKDGQYLKTIPMQKGNGQTITVINDKYIVKHPGRNYVKDDKYEEGCANLYYSSCVTDLEGHSLFAQCDTLKGDELSSISLDWDPVRWYYNGQLYFYNEIDATIYAVTEKGTTPKYHILLGDNQWKVVGKITPEYIGYIKFKAFKETADYLYIYWNQNQKAYFARFAKKTGKLNVHEQTPIKGRFWHLTVQGLLNDIDGCGYNMTLEGSYDKSSSIIFKIDPDNIEQVKESLEKATNVKYPQKRQQLIKMLNERREDDNPLLVIYKLKK